MTELHQKNEEEKLNKEEKENILKVLDKKNNPNNNKKLDYFFTIYKKEKKQDKSLYFYQFIFNSVKHQLKDKIKWKSLVDDWLPILFVILLWGVLVFFIFRYFNVCYTFFKANDKMILGTVITLFTVIVTTFFFVIKNYIDTKLHRGEKKMYSEMETRFDNQDSNIKKRFDNQDLNFETRFDNQDSIFKKRFDYQDSKFDNQNSRFDDQDRDIKDIKEMLNTLLSNNNATSSNNQDSNNQNNN